MKTNKIIEEFHKRWLVWADGGSVNHKEDIALFIEEILKAQQAEFRKIVRENIEWQLGVVIGGIFIENRKDLIEAKKSILKQLE